MRSRNSDLTVNNKGQLCHPVLSKMGRIEFIFNGIKEDRWIGVMFFFNDKFICKKLGW
jgi:hypothetical protein